MKILLCDIETGPATAFVWGLFDQNISIDKIIDTSKVICWSARWHGETKMMSSGSKTDGHRTMIRSMHALMSEADAVVTYNGNRFDLPVLNREFLMAGMKPPAPYKSIDLYQTVKRKFRFLSGKLDFVSQQLGLGNKVRHAGFEMWVKAMAGDEAALRAMKRYNVQDVVLLEKLYDRMLPWIANHPNAGAYDDRDACPHCGEEKLQKRGVQVTRDTKYVRYQCGACGAWSRGKKAVSGTKTTVQGVS